MARCRQEWWLIAVKSCRSGGRNSAKCVDFGSVEKGVGRFGEQPSRSVGELSTIPPGA